MDFLIADLSRPEGQAFANQQQVGSTTLIFFTQDGQRLGDTGRSTGTRIFTKGIRRTTSFKLDRATMSWRWKEE